MLASPSKIYIVLEFVTGGELFDRIVRNFHTCRQRPLVKTSLLNFLIYEIFHAGS